MRAAEITVERVSCDNLTVRITITAYLNSQSGVFFGGELGESYGLSFGDGESVLVPETLTIPRPDLGNNVGIAVFTATHTYASPSYYEIQYSEPFRNEGVVNLSNSISTPLNISTSIRLDVNSCNSYPKLLIPPVDRACSGVAFSHNPGAYDDGDSLTYEIIEPIGVQMYRSPGDPVFYLPNQPLNEEGTGPAVFTIDPATGLLTWDAAGAQGEYNIAIKITEWGKDPATGKPIIFSTIIRDMQIVVEDCDNNRPDLIIPSDTCVVAGAILDLTIYGTDPENNLVKIEAYSEVFELSDEMLPAVYSPNPFAFFPSNPPAELTFSWNTSCLHVRNQPYQVVFKITDQPSTGPKLVTYKSWNIRVVGPKPVWQNIEPDLVSRHALLKWDAYGCDSAKTIQVWRRVDQFVYSSTNCNSLLPESMGYENIAELQPTSTQYLDTNAGKKLSVGAKYCYRLIAVMPNGNYSPVSDELCMGPIQVDAPVITHVSVEKTSIKSGSIRVSWRSPFEIDKIQYPEPYEYEIYRGVGLEFSNSLNNVARVSDTTFLDAGLNTEEEIYNYTIVLYSKTQNNSSYSAVDTSSTASSIKLVAKAMENSVELAWDAKVPWSNHAQDYPRHLIYRGEYGTPESELTLIDSVDVSSHGFAYVDNGKYLNIPLDDNTLYCYRIMTRGVYGNPSIEEPLENFSPLICSYPINELLPCSPQASVVKQDCDEFLSSATCGPFELSNSIQWDPPTGSGCRLDIDSYSIYAADNTEGEYELIASNVQDLFYVEKNLTSLARCYRVVTVDKLGRTSEFNSPVCGENCTFYELPNVFTPNGDGCNDHLSAYYQPNAGEEGELCHVVDQYKCPRFVKQVSIKVYNRWGKEVYGKVYGDENIYINWDGKDNNGKELTSAVYYYEAIIKFDAIDPAKQNQTLKGWVHLIR